MWPAPLPAPASLGPRNSTRRPPRRKCSPRLEALEGRQLLAHGIDAPFPPKTLFGDGDLATGPDGSVWVDVLLNFPMHLDGFIDSEIVRQAPDGSKRAFPLPSGLGAGSMAVDRAGDLWFACENAHISAQALLDSNDKGAAIGRMTPGGQLTEFPLPAVDGITGNVFDIAVGPDGNLWFTVTDTLESPARSAIGRITPSGAITEFPLPSPGGDFTPNGFYFTTDLVAGPRGNLWFVVESPNAIGRITTGGVITLYPTGQVSFYGLHARSRQSPAVDGVTTQGLPLGLQIAARGDLRSGPPLTPSDARPGVYTFGADRSLWFADITGVGHITRSGRRTEYQLSRYVAGAANDVIGMKAGPRGAIYADDVDAGWLKITPSKLTPPGPRAHLAGRHAGASHAHRPAARH